MDAQEVKALIRRMNAAKLFPANTCAASRHAEMIADNLLHQRPHAVEDMQHCGESIAVTVAALWETRTAVERLTKARDAARQERDALVSACTEWARKVDGAQAERDKAVALLREAGDDLRNIYGSGPTDDRNIMALIARIDALRARRHG